MPTCLVPIADGSEEIETVSIVDTLVRAGFTVTLASVMPAKDVKCSRGVKISADMLIGDVKAEDTFDCIAIPGGMPGARNIADCEPFMTLLKAHVAAGRLYGAICAAPAVVLLPAGLIPEGASATCHPGFAATLPNCSEDRVVTQGKLVTSRGPGTAIEFALKLISLAISEEKAAEVSGPMLVK
mmetsp:Transcript_69092/g.137019  ORF Transcript_69092/g.137019 Transcript_69092/m.137019 type:complete len:184 (-) Transcript_69092:346-897(-)|eukprot:CAMPEP_0174734246 /NCGR_PEP_ID=MMETSP1094-20130205/62915_1 /TAXON_ID=156173 /ORGANISM="Chrysochromulina brevifilum, Strain UTEX LB 985" /LENGTH=183 /DNA_ID=CAMNT_0015937035 /DNA_START=83 /DNA_END=634 /DNA_ORIENTATION=-